MEQAIVDKRAADVASAARKLEAATPRVQALRDRQKGDAGLEEQRETGSHSDEQLGHVPVGGADESGPFQAHH